MTSKLEGITMDMVIYRDTNEGQYNTSMVAQDHVATVKINLPALSL